jgi:putative membrane protein
MYFDFLTFGLGAKFFLYAFVTAGLFALVFKFVYQWVTPYNESALIKQGNVPAAITLGGALIGYVLALASAVSHTSSLPELAAWATLAGVIQIVAFTLVRVLFLKDVKARIEAGEMAPAVYLASVNIAVGLINAASMTS